VFVTRRQGRALGVAAQRQPSGDRRSDDRGVVVDTQNAVERMRRSEFPRLIGGALGARQVERNKIRGFGAFERAGSLGGDRQVRTRSPGGLDECSGAVGSGGKKKKEASQATSSRPRSRGSRPSRDR
jgi:hypothetical protein